MPAIELKNVSNRVCRDISLAVADRELLVLIGPVGAGKTSLLNVIAGLDEYRGSVRFDGRSVDGLPAASRKVGYLFQNLLLFPHLTVEENIVYGLKVRSASPEKTRRRAGYLIDFFHLEGLAERYPANLSGGEKQRVALARALAPEPEILLLDEPFSNLDYKTTKYLRLELKRLQRELKITAVYVTHDQFEAEEIADSIAVLHEGRLVQAGTAEEIFFHPADEAVADFIGRPNILDCESSRVLGGGLVEVLCSGVPIVVPHHGGPIKKIAVFPRDIYVSPDQPPGPEINRFRAVIEEIRLAGALVVLTLKLGENTLVSEVPRVLFETLGVEVGSAVFLILKFRWIRVC
ncbi:MAG: ABC transporter ATP-binding protein [Candidatus Erginobacter occultus]|nr:ABC transporter ATP-binding protein [Candidatus Erginobacter occultus]